MWSSDVFIEFHIPNKRFSMQKKAEEIIPNLKGKCIYLVGKLLVIGDLWVLPRTDSLWWLLVRTIYKLFPICIVG